MLDARREHTVSGLGTADAPGVPGPARVVIADISAPLPDLDCRHATAGRYQAVWVLAVHGDTPLGLVEVPVRSEVLPGPELSDRLRSDLGDRWSMAAPGSPRAGRLPTIAVVVPTNVGRPLQLQTCVEALSRLDYPSYEVIVVDNRRGPGTHDDLLASLATLPRVRVVAERRPGISAARNRGVGSTDAEVVAFTDDDVRVHPRWLHGIGRRYATETDLDAVTGLVLPEELETPAQLLFEQSGSGLDRAFQALTFELAAPAGPKWRRLAASPKVRRSEDGGSIHLVSLYATGEFGLGSNMSFRTQALRDLGGFDPNLGVGTPTCGGEDLAMLLDLLMDRRKLGYEPRAIVHHTHRRSLEELEAQLHGYGTGFAAMMISLMWRDHRHIRAVTAAAPGALRAMTKADSAKRAGRSDGYPKQLARAELRGMAAGPWAYLRARRAGRAWAP